MSKRSKAASDSEALHDVQERREAAEVADKTQGDFTPRVFHNPKAWGPLKDAKGHLVRGRNEIDPGSLPKAVPPKPDLGVPVIEMVVIERAQDKRAFRCRVLRVTDVSLLDQCTETIFETKTVFRTGFIMQFKIAMGVFYKRIRTVLGMRLPGGFS